MKRFLSVVGLIAIAGCAQIQNVTTADLRTPANLVESKTLPMTIEQIGSAIFNNRLVCRSMPTLEVDPLNPTHAFMSSEEPGLSRSSVTTLIEFFQQGDKTRVDIYTLSPGRKVLTDRWIHAIVDPKSCG